jgi:hypothetical protein
MREKIFSIALLSLITTSLFSQKISDKKHFKWNFDFTGGPLIGGPNHDLKTALITSIYPHSLAANNDFSRSVNVSRKIDNYLSLDVCVSNNLCYIHSTDYIWLKSKFKIITASLSLMASFKDVFFVGLGPAVYLISYSWTDEPGEFDGSQQLGLLFKSTLKFPRKSRLYAKFDLQFRYIGEMENVPFSWLYGRSSIYTGSATVNMNNMYFGFGLGIRL